MTTPIVRKLQLNSTKYIPHTLFPSQRNDDVPSCLVPISQSQVVGPRTPLWRADTSRALRLLTHTAAERRYGTHCSQATRKDEITDDVDEDTPIIERLIEQSDSSAILSCRISFLHIDYY